MDRRVTSMWTATAALFLLAFAAAPLSAQQTGAIRGTVAEADGTPIVGATVMVEGTQLGTLSGRGGSFEIDDVPVGTQTVRTQALGYRSASRTVTVQAGMAATVDFTLTVDALNMQEIVVTGTATGVQKQQSSFAVTTVRAPEINSQAPQSTADLLKAVPGFHVEASGGVGGNNVFARGIPQPGSFRFLAMHEDGLPVFEAPELAFLNVDELHRVDQTVETMEAVRGGTASIFASNAPGGLINFVSKTGGEELGGVVKLTGGDYNLFRTDFNYGGPLLDDKDWRFNVGGFYRFDTGVRDPGFPANRGGQVKANITHLMENGYVRIRAKYLDDRNIFFLPIPLQNPSDPTGIPGFDPNFGTMTTTDAGRIQVPVPGGGTLEHNLRDGVHVVTRQIGGEVQLDLGDGWSVKENFRFMSGNVDFNALFSLFSPEDAASFAQAKMDELGGTGFQYSFAKTGQPISSPGTLNGNGLVMEEGWWNVKRPYDMFANEIRLTKDMPEVDNSITAGFYFSNYSSDEVWNFNNVLLEARQEPRLLDLEITGVPGPGTVSVTDDGVTSYGDFYRNAANNGHLFAIWLQDEWSPVEALTFDIGGRYESHTLSGNSESLEDFDLGGPTLADDAVTWGSGEFFPYQEEYDEWAVSGGVNVDVVQDRFALFGRGTRGFRVPDFDQLTEQPAAGDFDGIITRPDAENVLQFEGGLKYSSPWLGAFVTVFWSQLENVPFSDEVLDPDTGETVVLDVVSDAETLGTEIEVLADLGELTDGLNGFKLDVNATLQDPEITAIDFTGDVQAPPGVEFEGNQIRRIPEFIVQFRPSYEAPIQGGQSFRLFGSWFFENDRFEDFANEGLLAAYNTFGAGMDVGLSEEVTVEVRANNLSNAVGVTEGNPRTSQLIGGQENIFMGRPILGRNVRVALAYKL